jgi:hypothetical protein
VWNDRGYIGVGLQSVACVGGIMFGVLSVRCDRHVQRQLAVLGQVAGRRHPRWVGMLVLSDVECIASSECHPNVLLLVQSGRAWHRTVVVDRSARSPVVSVEERHLFYNEWHLFSEALDTVSICEGPSPSSVLFTPQFGSPIVRPEPIASFLLEDRVLAPTQLVRYRGKTTVGKISQFCHAEL